MDNPIPRCPRRTFQAGGIKMAIFRLMNMFTKSLTLISFERISLHEVGYACKLHVYDIELHVHVEVSISNGQK